MGSLVAAAASFLRARQAGGEWLLRIEDIDPPREVAGASDSFLRILEQFGFEWDGQVTYQSSRHDMYRTALQHLNDKQQSYRCLCSRRLITENIAAIGGPAGVYPGTCRDRTIDEDTPTSWRFNTQEQTVSFIDLLQGSQDITFGLDQGDFVIWRKDDLPSYQLAVTVDDIAQGITEVVRGADLLHETAGQIALRHALANCETPLSPAWMHVPVLVNDQGAKLSKQTAAPALDAALASQQLCTALEAIGLPINGALRSAAVRDIWQYAIHAWEPNKLFGIQNTVLEPVQT